MKIRVIGQGKTKDASLRALQADYLNRIGHFGEVTMEEMPASTRQAPPHSGKLSAAEQRLLEKLRGSYKVVLDGSGREWTSEEFAAWLGKRAVGGTRELAFVVGGPDGFSRAFCHQADLLLALSRLTLTHDWARTLLLEQIYRGYTVLRGYPYAR
jgi:23S rRNA (pseudouridine1915-N3)-methyltransferase